MTNRQGIFYHSKGTDNCDVCECNSGGISGTLDFGEIREEADRFPLHIYIEDPASEDTSLSFAGAGTSLINAVTIEEHNRRKDRRRLRQERVEYHQDEIAHNLLKANNGYRDNKAEAEAVNDDDTAFNKTIDEAYKLAYGADHANFLKGLRDRILGREDSDSSSRDIESDSYDEDGYNRDSDADDYGRESGRGDDDDYRSHARPVVDHSDNFRRFKVVSPDNEYDHDEDRIDNHWDSRESRDERYNDFNEDESDGDHYNADDNTFAATRTDHPRDAVFEDGDDVYFGKHYSSNKVNQSVESTKGYSNLETKDILDHGRVKNSHNRQDSSHDYYYNNDTYDETYGDNVGDDFDSDHTEDRVDPTDIAVTFRHEDRSDEDRHGDHGDDYAEDRYGDHGDDRDDDYAEDRYYDDDYTSAHNQYHNDAAYGHDHYRNDVADYVETRSQETKNHRSLGGSHNHVDGDNRDLKIGYESEHGDSDAAEQYGHASAGHRYEVDDHHIHYAPRFKHASGNLRHRSA